MEERLTVPDEDRALFPGSYAIRALRDSRYHNTAYAIAELIDNSVEAGAPLIELLCMESMQMVNARMRRRIAELAVVDNGPGMDAKTLLDALKFGGGTRHNTLRGIGKYGMGLPTSSMSQCKRVDVWTWQNGLESVWHSSLDADAIENGDHLVPIPDRLPIPDAWRRVADPEIWNGRTGTLVVWSNLDKIQWKTAETIIRHTQSEIGRIHRIYLDAKLHAIQAASFLSGSSAKENITPFVANDPLYLMQPSSTPVPWDNTPMFKEWGEPRNYPHKVDGRETTIQVRYSIVRPEALETEIATQNPGNEPHGRHARRNIGVSVVREDREIVLEDAFLREGGSVDHPQNRWWGCEVSFRKESDELFGVDHNKQMVANFSQAARILGREDRNSQAVLDEIGADDELIYEIVADIRNQIIALMREIRQMFQQKRRKVGGSSPKSPEDKATETATAADRESVAAGRERATQTDIDRDTIPPDKREEGLTEQFVEGGQSQESAVELARKIVAEGRGYHFGPAQLDGSSMFNVRSRQGVLHINLNTDHPIYNLLSHIEGTLDEERADEDDPVFQATVAIRLLLAAWARMEDQTPETQERRDIQNTALNWGRHVEKVINHLRDNDD